jgi:hypothetical protein
MTRSLLIVCVAISAPVGSGWAQTTAWDSPDGGELLVMPEDYQWRTTTDDPPRDAGHRQASTQTRDDPCAAQEKQIQDRKAWLAKRAGEQATRGVPDPYTGIPNLTGIHCEQHPEDAQCRLGPAPSSFEPDELSIDALKTPEDRDPYVIGLKRELEKCRRKFSN